MLSLYELKKILNPKQDSTPEDDFRIIQSWAEYDEKSSKPPEERNLKYLCYELEVMNPDTGEITHFYKAIKFARVIRLPANAKQSTAFMDMQEQILAGVHERNYNMITIIANVIKPVALGLLYLYGIQGVAESLEKAKEKAYYDFKGFVGMLQGTFRVLEIKCVEAQETEWLREKMYNMDYMTVVRGIPKANKAGEDAGNRGMGGSNINPDSQGTLEEMITGMADYEYVIEVLSTPVYLDTLTGWQRQSQKEMTAWYSQLQGTKLLQRVRGRMNMPWWNQFRYWIFLKRNRNISCIISQHFLQMLPGKMFSEYSNISIVRCFFRKNIPHIHTCQEYLKVEYSLLCRIFQSSLFHLC